MTTPPALSVIIDTLALALIHFLWQGALIAAILWLLLRYIPSARSGLRYGAACASIAAMCLCVPMSALYLMAQQSHVASTATDTRSITQPVLRRIVIGRPEAPAVSASRGVSPPAILPAAQIVAGWMIGTALCLLRLLGGFVVIRRIAGSARPSAPEAVAARFAWLAKRLKLRRTPRLLISDRVAAPMALGIFRTVVVLPAALLTAMSPPMIEALLIHELAHLRRSDFAVNLLQCLAETLLFYHPAVWWVSRAIRSERESCCDDRVVAMLNDRSTYARALLALEQMRIPQPALAANGSAPVRRIRRILVSYQ